MRWCTRRVNSDGDFSRAGNLQDLRFVHYDRDVKLIGLAFGLILVIYRLLAVGALVGRESTKSRVSASGNNFGPSSKRLYAYKVTKLVCFLTYEAVWSTLLMLHITGTNSAKTSKIRAVDLRWLHFPSPFDCSNSSKISYLCH